MKRKLDTRFPAARIKKIMQTDEEVGKLALATPVLVSRALELFLQDICNKTYEVTADKGAKTVSVAHLKACVVAFSEFDFLQEVVSSATEATGSAEADEGGCSEQFSTRKDCVPRVKEEPGTRKDEEHTPAGGGDVPCRSGRGRKRLVNGVSPTRSRQTAYESVAHSTGPVAEVDNLQVAYDEKPDEAMDPSSRETKEANAMPQADDSSDPQLPAQKILKRWHSNGLKERASSSNHAAPRPLGFDLNAEPDSMPEELESVPGAEGVEVKAIGASSAAEAVIPIPDAFSAGHAGNGTSSIDDEHLLISVPSSSLAGSRSLKTANNAASAEEDDYDCDSQ